MYEKPAGTAGIQGNIFTAPLLNFTVPSKGAQKGTRLACSSADLFLNGDGLKLPLMSAPAVYVERQTEIFPGNSGQKNAQYFVKKGLLRMRGMQKWGWRSVSCLTHGGEAT